MFRKYHTHFTTQNYAGNAGQTFGDNLIQRVPIGNTEENMKPTLKQIMRQTMLLRKFRKEWEAEIMKKGMEENE